MLQYEVLLEDLKPHPKNIGIYGDENVDLLVEQIQETGWIKPLTVSSTLYIISGHRRFKAAKILGIERLLVEVEDFKTETEELQRLLSENASREKSITQKARELELWKSLFKQSTIPTTCRTKEPGKRNQTALSQASEKVSVSERTGRDMLNVVKRIDYLEKKGFKKEAEILTIFHDQAASSAARFLKNDQDGKKLTALADKSYDDIVDGKLKVRDFNKILKESNNDIPPFLKKCMVLISDLKKSPINPISLKSNQTYWENLLDDMESILLKYRAELENDNAYESRIMLNHTDTS